MICTIKNNQKPKMWTFEGFRTRFLQSNFPAPLSKQKNTINLHSADRMEGGPYFAAINSIVVTFRLIQIKQILGDTHVPVLQTFISSSSTKT